MDDAEMPGQVVVVLDPGLLHLRRLVRRTQRTATSFGVGWVALDVQVAGDDERSRTFARSTHVDEALDYARSLGGATDRVEGRDWVEAVLGFARANQVKWIVLGHQRRGFGMGMWALQHVRRLLDGAGDVEILIVSFPERP